MDKMIEPLTEENISITPLPELCSQFHVPRLLDKPQNPIMESLHLLQKSWVDRQPSFSHKQPGIQPKGDKQNPIQPEKTLDLWGQAAKPAQGTFQKALSWDALRPTFNSRAGPSAFLSEQSIQVYASARFIAQPTILDPSTHHVYVLPSELFKALQMTLLGDSSPLHVWDPATQQFLLRPTADGKSSQLIVAGMDVVVSQSFMQRFITIGTLTRRIEHLGSELRKGSNGVDPTLHAFGHAISSILTTTRHIVSEQLLAASDLSNRFSMEYFTALWNSQSETEQILCHLAKLCHREEHIKSSSYKALPGSAPELLSWIYTKLDEHLEHHSTHRIIAILAFILTSVSSDYFDRLCQTVGYGLVKHTQLSGSTMQEDRFGGSLGLFEEDEEEKPNQTTYDMTMDNTFPTFFSPDFSQALVRARQSLKLLRSAQPDHPLLGGSDNRRIRWFWTEPEAEAAWLHRQPSIAQRGWSSTYNASHQDLSGHIKYQQDIQTFHLFDLEPGSHLDFNAKLDETHDPVTSFAFFLKIFPPSLPSLTPSLTTLTNLVLYPLVQHTSHLSTALVSTFLPPLINSGSLPSANPYLNFHTHLVLLRSYLLITSPAFRSRLSSALFSDASEPPSPSLHARTIAIKSAHAKVPGRTRAPTRITTSSARGSKHEPTWIIGLAGGLTEGDSWPPGGADLSYHLRTVIVDSLDTEYPNRYLSSESENNSFYTLSPDISKGEQKLYQEAEWRLGFALRDLPIGSHAKWLNPYSMEALDFLYIDYQPPKPLDALIPPDALSKYHRIFAFNLRLMRVEHVIKALFRMSLHRSDPPFPTFSASQKIFLHFRWVANSFVGALSSYVYDTAIGARYDAFLAKLNPQHDTDPHALGQDKRKHMFNDVFVLAEQHSKMLDDILSACLLRSNQKNVGDLLRGVLAIVLEFGILMADRRSGKLEEYQAVDPLREIWQRFERRMKTLVKMLRAVIEKVSSTSRFSLEEAQLQALSGQSPQGTSVVASLHSLLVRLDVAQWWQQAAEKRVLSTASV